MLVVNVGSLEKRSNQPKYKEPKTRSPKTTAKPIQNNGPFDLSNTKENWSNSIQIHILLMQKACANLKLSYGSFIQEREVNITDSIKW